MVTYIMNVTAIIPIYNEEKTIKNVISAIKTSPLITEILCVDDGSYDNSAEVVKKIPGVKLISLKKNHGKANAISTGIEMAKGDIVLFVDGDLVGFDSEAIEQLITPLINGDCDVTVGYPDGIMDKPFRPITGERAYFRKDIKPYIKELRSKGFGMEPYLNYIFRNKRVKAMPLKKMKNSMKYKKYSLIKANIITIKEIIDISKELFKKDHPADYFKYSYLSSFYINKNNTSSNLDKKM